MKPLCLFLLAAALVPAAACKKSPAPASAATTTPAPAAPGTPAAAPTPAKPVPAQLPDVLAKVNGQEVRKADFDMMIRDMELGQGPVPAERRAEVLRGTLDRLITYTVLSQEAKTRNVTATDAEIDDRVKQMQSQFPTEEAFKKALGERNMTIERLRTDTRDNLVISKMMDAEVATTPGASDAEAKEFYDKNPDKFKQGETLRASHILIRVDETADAATKQKAKARIDAILKRAKAGEDFAKLAKENSADGSAAQGGDLGFFPRGQMVPAFDQAAFALKPGEISDVVTTQFGYHIIKAVEHKEAATVPLAEVSEKVKQFLSNQKKQTKADEFIASLKQKSKIEVLI
ncbi:MAG: peptidylprolyl isomerase [Vicinamibacterales bacterium]